MGIYRIVLATIESTGMFVMTSFPRYNWRKETGGSHKLNACYCMLVKEKFQPLFYSPLAPVVNGTITTILCHIQKNLLPINRP